MSGKSMRVSRRALLRGGVFSAGWLGLHLLGAPPIVRAAGGSGRPLDLGPLSPPDAHGLRLPRGFRSRIVATSGEPVASTGHVWHWAPDGGATFATPDGGWIYVSNAEIDADQGGAGAIRFAADGSIVDAYSILDGTNRNCAGGATPWATWLSCEEIPRGRVYECDPFTPGAPGVALPALGVFEHEAVAVDPVARRLYLTEDRRDGLLYRFTPSRYPSLEAGRLEAAEILDPDGLGPIGPGSTRGLAWHPIPDPSASREPTRYQAPRATPFDGAEGCSFHAGQLFLTSKGDDRVWRLDTRSDRIEILYDRATSPTPILSGVDNVLAAPSGRAYVAEDPGDLQIVVVGPDGALAPLVQVTGHPGSEVTGPALSPDGRRLYFSSQRPGVTYEVTGPFDAV